MSDHRIRVQIIFKILCLHRNVNFYSSRGYKNVTTTDGKGKPTFLCSQATPISTAIFYILLQKGPKKDRKSI